MNEHTDNELIALFMGGKSEPEENHGYSGWGGRVWISLPNTAVTPTLRYHNSWDWLMPVAVKINSIGYDVLINATGLNNETHSCDITTTTDVQAATSGYILIDVVYKAVVEFIKWYNDNKGN